MNKRILSSILLLLLCIGTVTAALSSYRPALWIDLKNATGAYTDRTGNYTPGKIGTMADCGNPSYCTFPGASGVNVTPIVFSSGIYSTDVVVAIWWRDSSVSDAWLAGQTVGLSAKNGILTQTGTTAAGWYEDAGGGYLLSYSTPNSSWHLSVWRYTNTNATMWFDGVHSTNAGINAAMKSSTASFTLADAQTATYSFTGDISMVAVWNNVLGGWDAAEMLQLYNAGPNSTWVDFYGAQSVSDFNVTSAYANQTAWRTNRAEIVYSRDTTPTVTGNAVFADDLCIGKYDLNYTACMQNTSNAGFCSTTNATAFSCTLSDQLAQGLQNIFISASQNQNTTSTSGPLRISEDWEFRGNVTNANGAAMANVDIFVIDVLTNSTITGPVSTVSTSISNSSGNYICYVPFSKNVTIRAELRNRSVFNTTVLGPFNLI